MSSTGQSSPFFLPNQISGCQLWLDAADTSTMTPSNPSNGASIVAWRDKSTTNKIVTVSSPPRYLPGATNNKSVLVFANGPQVSASLPAAIGTGDVCLVAVWSVTVGGTNTVLGIGPASAPSLGIGFSATKYNFYDFGVAGGESAYNTTTTNFYLIEIGTRISGVMQLFVNGTAYTAATNTTATNQTSTTMYVGNGAFAINGNIAEIVVYNSTVNSSQRQQLEGYLAWKWGLQNSLPSTHPYRSTPYPPFVVASVPTALAANFQPPQVSGLALWLDASDAATITGSSPITGWTDKSGTGKTVTFVGANNTYSSAAQSVNTSNGTAGAATYFYANVNLKRSVVPNVSVFLVYTWTGSGISTEQPLWGQDIGGGWNRFQLLSFPATPAIAYGLSYQPASPYVTVASSLNTANKLVYSATYALNAPNGTFVNVNGSLASSLVTEVPASPETSTTNTYFGTIDTGYSGRVAYHEILIYTANLTVVQRQQVEGYLAWKWSLTSSFSSTFPYKTIPPSISTLPIYPRAVITPGVWNPTQISGCTLWLDAADQSTLTLVGSAVTVWMDKSGNGRNATAPIAPTLVQGMQNKLPAIYFNGASYFTGSLTNTTNQQSFFAVFRYNTGAPQYARLASFGVNNIADFNNVAYYNMSYNTGTLAVTRNSIETGVTLLAPALDTFHQASIIFNGANGLYYTEGGTYANSAAWTANFNFNQYRLGSDQTPFVPQQMIGYIGEVIVYSGGVTTQQRQQVEGYLAWKWGLQKSLPGNHPWANWPPPPS